MDTPVRILFVEDDAALRESLLEILQDEGHAVQGASGSAQALRLAGEQAFDLVVTDIRMAGMSDDPYLGRHALRGQLQAEYVLDVLAGPEQSAE